MIEWAPWWGETLDRWTGEGLDTKDVSCLELQERFGLDPMECLYSAPRVTDAEHLDASGRPAVRNEAWYEAIRERLFSSATIDKAKVAAVALKERHAKGEVVIRLWLDGFFWFPRTLLGIERHLYAFYDEPALMHRMNEDLTEFNIRTIRELFPILKPDMVGFGEDMSYNNGPMLSEASFDEFLVPYYQRVIPHIKAAGVKVLVDSDGDISSMVPWLQRAGLEGIYPLERQAGVDLVQLRRDYPDFLYLGGYDKMVMSQGEAAMRAEFERLLPVMRSGGFVPSVDHQTPPGVSLDNYRIYLRLFEEFARKAAK